ncbi:MAG: SRPBCC family protein, partial [Stackebrandtia sp.]
MEPESPWFQLETRRDFTVSPQRLWQAFTQPEQLKAWFWPAGLDPDVEVDARVGSRFRISSATKGFAVSGVFVESDFPRRLAFNWMWDGRDAETLVSVEFEAADDGSAMVLRHQGFADEASRDDHIEGWS